jgi:hypothetical protein
MFLFSAFDTYVVKVLGGHHKANDENLNIILHFASNNNLHAIHVASLFVST